MALPSALRNTPVLPLFALAFALAVGAYAVLHGSGDTAEAPTPTFGIAPTTSLGGVIQFTSPNDGAAVSNPVSVTFAIGGGLRFQKEGEPEKPGYGHAWLLIDESLPLANATLTTAANRIDLPDASHQATLPDLTPGAHMVHVVWTDSLNKVVPPVISATLSVTVASP